MFATTGLFDMRVSRQLNIDDCIYQFKIHLNITFRFKLK